MSADQDGGMVLPTWVGGGTGWSCPRSKADDAAPARFGPYTWPLVHTSNCTWTTPGVKVKKNSDKKSKSLVGDYIMTG
jgi:hypothetical protein